MKKPLKAMVVTSGVKSHSNSINIGGKSVGIKNNIVKK